MQNTQLKPSRGYAAEGPVWLADDAALLIDEATGGDKG